MRRVVVRSIAWWNQLNTAYKLLIILDTLAIFSIGLVLGLTSTLVARGLDSAIDRNMEYHVTAARALVAREVAYLDREARTLVKLDGLAQAVQAGDIDHLRRLLMPVYVMHKLSGIYVLTTDGQVLAAIGEDQTTLPQLPLSLFLEQARSEPSAGLVTAAGDVMSMVGVAAQRDHDGQIQAFLVPFRQVDRDFLLQMKESLGPDFVLGVGPLTISSLPAALSSDDLDALAWNEIDPAGSIHYRTVTIAGERYRALVRRLGLATQPLLSVGVLQSTAVTNYVLPRAIANIAVLGILLIVVTVGLVNYLLIRVFRPLERLREYTQLMTQGNLDVPVDTQGTVEIRELAAAFEQMRGQLRAHMEAQRTWNAELERQVEERTEELQALCVQRDRLLAKVIDAQEEEQRRIARELHDDTSQALANVAITIGTAAQVCSDDAMRQQLQHFKGLVVESLENLRRIVIDMRPRLLDDYGLMMAIRWHAQERLTKAGVPCEIDIPDTDLRLAPYVEIGAFRIVQEAISNSIRHAQASHVTVHVVQSPDRLSFTIEDDGRGFDVARAKVGRNGTRGLGLLGMEERAELIGGRLMVESCPGVGTQVHLDIPLTDPGA